MLPYLNTSTVRVNDDFKLEDEEDDQLDVAKRTIDRVKLIRSQQLVERNVHKYQNRVDDDEEDYQEYHRLRSHKPTHQSTQRCYVPM